MTCFDRFLLVEFQLNHVLSEIDPREMLVALHSVPSDLPEAYETVFVRIERRSKGAKALALRIVSWIYNAKRPLSIWELQEALAVVC